MVRPDQACPRCGKLGHMQIACLHAAKGQKAQQTFVPAVEFHPGTDDDDDGRFEEVNDVDTAEANVVTCGCNQTVATPRVPL